MTELPVGTILKPNVNYEENWSTTDFYDVLEHYRPKDMLSHKNSVFMFIGLISRLCVKTPSFSDCIL